MFLTQNNSTFHTRERKNVWVQTYPFMVNLLFHGKLTLSWCLWGPRAGPGPRARGGGSAAAPSSPIVIVEQFFLLKK